MRRLLQGDVGAGKTVLAAYAALAVVESNGQVALTDGYFNDNGYDPDAQPADTPARKWFTTSIVGVYRLKLTVKDAGGATGGAGATWPAAG